MDQSEQDLRLRHGHTATIKEIRFNRARVASTGVHCFLGKEDRRSGNAYFLLYHLSVAFFMVIQKMIYYQVLTCRRAIEYGDLTTVLKHLEAGVNPNSTNRTGETLLHIAVLHQRASIVQILLENKADPNARTKWTKLEPFINHVPLLNPSETESNGATPLHYACAISNAKLVKMLLNAGATTSINVGNNEMCQTPLVWAISIENQLELIELLLMRGASAIDCRDVEDNNSIAMAVMHYSEPNESGILYKLLKLFVEEGVEINHKNFTGWTAYDIASTKAIQRMLQGQFNAQSGRFNNDDGLYQIGNIEAQRNEGQPWLRRR
ncbi:hypothetical protein THRCLA_01463 [Thraustotheca clavata]|uniref:Uncharacterized protein n=1 Tax=Thraustotheca clavata TaxID=74557 RepID=A0A1W0A862_9STRA|nr:hypothetical protein THRCLA_01463 [Thraustotheca clavata]